MRLEASGSISAGEKIQYLHTFLHEEYLREFKTLCGHISNSNTIHPNQIILGLGTYFFQVNMLPKQKLKMRHGMSNSRGLKFRNY